MSRSLSIAVIGAGASGLYIADQLMCRTVGAHIDLIDQTPAPIGIAAYSARPPRSVAASTTHLIGNVRVGTDVSAAELRGVYDVVIDATTFAEGVSEFTLDATIDIALAGAEATHPRLELAELLQRRGVPAARWVNPLNLPTGRGLREWQAALATSRGVPVCF